MTELITLLKRIQARWNKVFLTASLVKGIVLGGILPLLLLIVSRFIPILYNEWIAIGLWIVVIMVVLAMKWRQRSNVKAAARLVDAELGQDAVITALELEEARQPNLFQTMIVEQATNATTKYEQELKLRLPMSYGWNVRKWISLMSLTIILLLLLILIPNMQNDKAMQIISNKKVIEQIEEQITEMQETVEQSQIDEATKEQLLASLDELLNELDMKEGLTLENADELAQSLEELEQLKQESLAKMEELDQLEQALANEPQLEEFQKAFNESLNKPQAQREEGMKQAMQSLDSETAKALAEAMAQLAAQHNELAEAMQQLAEQAQSGELTEQAMNEFSEQLSEQLSAEQIAALASQLSQQMQQG
ncbi:MAG TPA: hypothetical protein IAA29_17640, partial [Candidatus Paenibacillus intestinavium]|nr:hypothetical protein [Candidatus Paenibacillus intestinavium]